MEIAAMEEIKINSLGYYYNKEADLWFIKERKRLNGKVVYDPIDGEIVAVSNTGEDWTPGSWSVNTWGGLSRSTFEYRHCDYPNHDLLPSRRNMSLDNAERDQIFDWARAGMYDEIKVYVKVVLIPKLMRVRFGPSPLASMMMPPVRKLLDHVSVIKS